MCECVQTGVMVFAVCCGVLGLLCSVGGGRKGDYCG
jgi:hypothetical protein